MTKNAEHLAGALTLEMGKEVTWRAMPDRDAAMFECDGHQVLVSGWDLFNLLTLDPTTRRDLIKRTRRQLEGPA